MCHVLVIEDEPLIAIYLADVAEMAGATSVDSAMSETEALALARMNPPAVILSDVDLKQGGTGPKVCAAIREEMGPIPVIFITATPELCEPCGYAAAILRKPIAHQHVIDVFRTVAP